MSRKRVSSENSQMNRKVHHLMSNDDAESEMIFQHAPLHMHLPSKEREEQGDEEEEENESQNHSLDGDRGSILLLTFLYVLQGIPLGLSGSIPMILSSRHVSYKDQAKFSFAFWPFSVKLLWAPIVDAAYSSKFGRRKTWLVPTQYLIGLFMIILSLHISEVLGENEGENSNVNVGFLTAVFFAMNFLAATQDIAVDGWALTMLSRKNVGWASTCNTVGQTAGYFLGNVVFLALESPDFCNKYLRNIPQKEGLVTLGSFMYFWGIVFFITTTLVGLFKTEKTNEDADQDQTIADTYKQLVKIIKLPAVKTYIVILLTAKIGFAAADGITGLKLIEAGVPKERLALLAVPMVPIEIILPLLLSRYTAGPRPMDVFIKAMPWRLVIGLIYAVLVWWAPSTQMASGEFPLYFYGVILFFFALHQVAVYSMFVSTMGFHAKISDPAIGGTYMTLLNTLSNLGGNWPTTVMLWFVDSLTWKTCSGSIGQCNNAAEEKLCTDSGGKCITSLDGYYVESLVCFFIGFAWLWWQARKTKRLQGLSERDWKCGT
ncbi:acetyl-coenzyme A transporter 1 [Lingula anatina]|uniref:Acetyl-coenzyme A transporter 1 n=1 Tax=Lingula anatina TaxID=7574 RepID=A0A1S3HT93_LINAN|nr:acetyl-coenzyme A transporter 1 [Lingula anatina]|eukprot:XP_013389260.1 acetyl-coenzyme A transporter 1 [Lingula anatina]